MSIIIKKVSKTFDDKVILDDVSISFNPREKIALVGENGVGKTTLLRILAGTEIPTSGKVSRDDYSETVIVAQDFPEEFIVNNYTGREYIDYYGGEKLERATMRIIKDFGITEDFMERRLSELSGGQKKVLDISRAFAQKPQYLLIDEPENHIDIFGRQVIIELMDNFRGCLIFVSHDQDIVNAVTNRIVEIVDGKFISFTGSYEAFLEEKERQNEARMREWKHHESEIKRLDALVKRIREWVKKNPDLGSVLRAKKTQLARMKDNAPDKPKKSRKMKMSINDVDQKKSKIILRIENFSLSFDKKVLFNKANQYLLFGEKVALVGRNGSGKTSLFRTVMGQVQPTSGSVRLGPNISLGYFSQDHMEMLDSSVTPLNALGEIIRGQDQKLRAVLAKFLIGEDSYNRPISTLSGGQKTRLRFCLLFNRSNEFLLLDEPTNHLDDVSWGVLVEAIKDFNGTILMVSHDRAFIDQTASKIWLMEDGLISDYEGTLTEYLSE